MDLPVLLAEQEGITLQLSHLIAIGVLLLSGYAPLVAVIKVLWSSTKGLQDDIMKMTKEALPIITEVSRILDDHNKLDAERSHIAEKIEALIKTETRSDENMALVAEYTKKNLELEKEGKLLLKELGDSIKDLHVWHDKDDPAHTGAKIWWGVSGIEIRKEMIRQLNRIEAGIGEIQEACTVNKLTRGNQGDSDV